MMKLCAGILRIFCWILAIFSTIYVFRYVYLNPTDRVGFYIRFPIVAIAIHTIPYPCHNRKNHKKFFEDNIKAFREYGQQKARSLNENRLVSYQSRKEKQLTNTMESVLSASLLNYVETNNLADDEPYVQIKHRKWGRGLKILIRCTWYRKFVFYWIPENVWRSIKKI